MRPTAEHAADMYTLARRRQAAGLPVWAEHILLGDVFRDEDRAFEERRDVIVERVKASRWYRNADPDEMDGVNEVVDCLAHADDVDEFDGWWSDLYDLADRARVWIDTIKSP